MVNLHANNGSFVYSAAYRNACTLSTTISPARQNAIFGTLVHSAECLYPFNQIIYGKDFWLKSALCYWEEMHHKSKRYQEKKRGGEGENEKIYKQWYVHFGMRYHGVKAWSSMEMQDSLMWWLIWQAGSHRRERKTRAVEKIHFETPSRPESPIAIW